MITNTTIMSREVYYSTQKTVFGFRAGTVSFVGGIVSILCGIGSIVLGIIEKMVLIDFLGFVVILFGVLFLAMPKIAHKNSVMKFDKLSKGGKTVKFFYEFFEDDYYVTGSEGRQRFLYGMLTGVYETTDFMFLMTDNASGLCIDKNSFFKGDTKSLRELLIRHKLKIIEK